MPRSRPDAFPDLPAPNPLTPVEMLAAAILAFDEDHPGEPDAAVEIDAETWAKWIDLAGSIIP